MRKKVVMGVFVLFIVLTAVVSVYAATNSTTDQEKINDAYKCLENKAGSGSDACADFSMEEKIFSLLADNLCHSEVSSASSNDGECWPSGSCKVKTTAQAVLALDNVGTDTQKAQDWLISQNRTPTELTWFLEIESSQATTCSIDYAGRSYSVNIGADKKITNNAGACLVVSDNDYWLRIAPSCYDESFDVSCTENFLTTLLFKKTTSSTIHVSDQSSSASAGGTTEENVNSFCLADSNVCNYEATLWGAVVLDSLGNDISSYMPYLITLADDNQRYLPDAFLYMITSDDKYRTSLLADQQSNKWWIASGDKLYDTALALYPFRSEDLPEKSDSEQWLFDTQGTNGCWENNVRDTAFILSSLWPRSFSGSGSSGTVDNTFDCEDAGYYCVPSGSASSNSIVTGYDCPALSVCSSSPVEGQTCSELGGVVCSAGQQCEGGTLISSADTVGQRCCIDGGTCKIVSNTNIQSECELSGGTCRPYGCNSGETDSGQACDFSSDACCIYQNGGSGGGGTSTLWIWILLILIVLVVVGIIFRDKLRMLWLRIRHGRKGSGSSSRPSGPRFGPGSGPSYSSPIPRRPAERRILLPPPVQPRPGPRPRPVGRPQKSGAQKELDDVLKKLKEMGK